MPDLATGQSNVLNSAVIIDRRFLLFKLELKSQGLRSFGGVDAFTGQSKQSLPGAFKFVDPLDWEDPNADEYWRNILKPDYTKNINLKWAEFKKNFFAAIQNPDTGIALAKDADGNPYQDVTDLVRTISGYTNSLDSFANDITVVLGPEATRDANSSFISFKNQEKTEAAPSDASDRAFDLTKADMSENDVLMIRTSRNGGPYELEFLGFVTQVTDDSTYGALSSRTLIVSGMSKLFSLSTIIKQKAINDERFQSEPINDLSTPAVLENLFQGKNAREIMSQLLEQVMAWEEITVLDTSTGKPQNPTAQLYGINAEQFIPTTPDQAVQSFQFNIFTLLTLLLMREASPTDQQKQHLFPAPSPETDPVVNNSGLLDKTTMAVMEHGDHVVWNDTVASGFENFFSQTTMPVEIFNDLRSYTYYDVFESRDGTIIVRPPRYNRIEISKNEFLRRFLDTDTTDASVLAILLFDPATGNFRFNPDADFFISSDITVDDVDAQREDMQLETRSDTKWTMPYVGPVDFPAGAYQDPNLIIKYGLRTQGPTDNPNVTNEKMATLYSPVVLGMLNAKTRKTTAVVRDVRTFRPGKLYYLEDLKNVAYLVSDEIIHSYGAVSKRNLAFNMVRRVVDIEITEIIKSDNMKLNFALMYLKDPAPIPALSEGEATKLKDDLILRATRVLEQLSRISQGAEANPDAPVQASGATIPMFRYVPTILDVIVDIDADPSIPKADKNKLSNSEQAAVDKKRRELLETQAVALYGGEFFATEINFGDSNLAKLIQDAGKIGASVFPDRNDKSVFNPNGGIAASEFGNFNPRVAVAKYGVEVLPGDDIDKPTGRPYYIFDSQKVKQPLVSTPFFAAQIAKNPADWLFSQVLINRLAILDITMKYQHRGLVYTENEPNVTTGFPQYYGADSNGYTLFGTPRAASDYARIAPTFSREFLKFVLKNHGANSLFFDGFDWKSPCFRIPSVGSHQFNMPFGHIMYGTTLAGTNNGLAQTADEVIPTFVRLSGGRYSFIFDPGGKSMTIQAISKEAEVVVDDVGGDSENSALSGSDKANAAFTNKKTLKIFFLGDAINSPTPLFCFLSPYLEPTVERMLELGLPPGLAGYRTNKDTNNLILQSKQKVLGENDVHTQGNGLDLCVEALVYYGQADILILPEVGTRMSTLMNAAGFKNTDPNKPKWAFNWIRNPDNIKIFWKYPDGTSGGSDGMGNKSPTPAVNYFHLGVILKDVLAYVNRVQGNLVNAKPQFSPNQNVGAPSG